MFKFEFNDLIMIFYNLKTDDLFRKKTFIDLFNKIAYPLLHHAKIPQMKLSDAELMEVIIITSYMYPPLNHY